MTEKQTNILTYIVAVIVIIGIIVLFSSCKTKLIHVPIESVKTEYKDKLVRDSIYLLDSVYVEKWRSNDTVFLTKEKYKYLYRDKIVRDSIFITDSIQVPYPVEVVREVNRLKTWQIILMCLGTCVIAIAGYRIYRLFN